MIQQVVSFSSAESEFYAIEAPNVDRRETLDHRRSRIGANPETRAEDGAERGVQVVEEVPDTIDSLNNEVKCARPVFVDPRSRGREPPDKISQELATFENANESPSNLDTRVLERDGMPSRVSKPGVATATSRLAVPWTTHTQWSYLGFICGLARTASASDEVIVNGHLSKRVNGTTTGVMEATDSISTFAVNAGAGGAVAGDAGLACGHEQAQWLESAEAAQRCSAVEHPKA